MTSLLRCLIVAWFIGCTLFISQLAEAVKPVAPLEVKLELTGTPMVGGEVQVLVRVRSILYAPKVKIRCNFPEAITLTTGEDNWEGEMEAGSVKEMVMIIKINKPGQHRLHAMTTIEYPGGANISKSEALLIDLAGASNGGSNLLGIESNQTESKPERKKKPLIRKGKDGSDIGEFPLD